MALAHFDFFSEVLGMSMGMDVVLPQASVMRIGMEGDEPAGLFPCLLLLHGLSDDHTVWQRRTSIERYAARYGLAVAMPSVHRSFYTDMDAGYPYWRYISEEIPAILQRYFPISPRREDNFVAGLSMGGYGAFKLGLRCPDRFAAAASLSGCLDLGLKVDEEEVDVGLDFRLVFGGQPVPGTANDLLTVATELVAGATPPPQLYQCCGTDDFLYAQNQSFKRHAELIGLPVDYHEGPGAHTWDYWDARIQDVLAWLPIER
jgi:putative tributyrin esterase